MKLDKYEKELGIKTFLEVCEQETSVGLLSDAGVPAVADPGAAVVKLAHEKGIKVVPLVGPSSILMALMASGMNGQNFAFNGYLPIEASGRKKLIRQLEKVSREKNQSQIFIETPYRNEKMFSDLKSTLTPDTLLCLAIDITLPSEYIRTYSISEWKTHTPSIHKRPAIFIIQR